MQGRVDGTRIGWRAFNPRSARFRDSAATMEAPGCPAGRQGRSSCVSPAEMPPGLRRRYDHRELIADAVVHAAGIALALSGSALLLLDTSALAGGIEYASICLYCLTLVAMLGFSAAYNLWPIEPRKWFLRRCDQATIYVSIAATLTPFALHARPGLQFGGFVLLLWALAFVGAATRLQCKVGFTPQSILPYFALAAGGILGFAPVWSRLPVAATSLVLTGGAAYSTGIIFFLWEGLRFHSVIWHCFVLLGAACCYLGILDCALT